MASDPTKTTTVTTTSPYEKIKALPFIEDDGEDGFYFKEVYATPEQTGIWFAVSDL